MFERRPHLRLHCSISSKAHTRPLRRWAAGIALLWNSRLATHPKPQSIEGLASRSSRRQMAAHAGKLAAVAHGAGRVVEAGSLLRVGIEKIRRVIGRLELRVFPVAERAAVGRIDLVMADQAIGHAQAEILSRHARLLDPVMAGLASVGRLLLIAHAGREGS